MTVDRLREEHVSLRDAILSTAAGLATVTDDDGVAASREQRVDLVARLSRHRHRSVDLVYETYNTDFSAGD